MRLILACFLLIFCLPAGAQRAPFLFTKDSSQYQIPKWIFVDGDKTEYALPSFDDHALPEVYTNELHVQKGTVSPFKGLAWLRLHFRLDTGLAVRPLAFELSQQGASELYLDGKQIYSRGRVGDAAHTKYYDPQHYPVLLTLADTMPHVLAIRYANWNYNNHSYLYDGQDPGFKFKVMPAQNAVDTFVTENDVSSIFGCILFGIFSILAILHFLFFLYYRQEKSNLWFSLFALSLALLALIPYADQTLSNPHTQLIIDFYSFFMAVLACFALSGFLNRLFSHKPLRFRIISAYYLIICLLYTFVGSFQGYAILAVISVAGTEALLVIGSAVIRRVPGARIIAAGLSLFVIMLLVVFVNAIVRHRIDFGINNAVGITTLSIVCVGLLSIPVSLSAYLASGFARVSRNLNRKLQEVETLSAKNRQHEAEKQQILEHQNDMLEQEVAVRTSQIEH